MLQQALDEDLDLLFGASLGGRGILTDDLRLGRLGLGRLLFLTGLLCLGSFLLGLRIQRLDLLLLGLDGLLGALSLQVFDP